MVCTFLIKVSLFSQVHYFFQPQVCLVVGAGAVVRSRVGARGWHPQACPRKLFYEVIMKKKLNLVDILHKLLQYLMKLQKLHIFRSNLLKEMSQKQLVREWDREMKFVLK